ncbi:hypothetical protein Trco_000763 [Trichoderma cornu-damae]|uniref:Uncharacterized protein n=1 Tax=Trichoderma cornu-damae TaxID=654480 RepID=A0A9P8QWP5_9HYPO|nr:hypothetical protein Trco_000763 [Trichoderma cornu-damae]
MTRSSRATRPPSLELDTSFSGMGVSEYSPDSLDLPLFSPSKRRTSFGFIKSSPTVNVHTTCGRHTDQLLFSGPSLSGLARTFLWKKKRTTGN